MSLQAAEQFEANEQFEEAFEEYKKLYEINPKDMNVLERLGHIAMMLDKKDDAAEFYTKMLEFDATNTMVYEQLMDIYQETDKFKYYINRGNLHSIEHKLEHAINDYKKALANTQDEKQIISTRFVLGSLYGQTGNNSKAIDEYLRVLDYDEIPQESYLQLAKLYVAESAVGSAVNVLERGYAKHADNALIRETLAEMYLRNNNPEKAIEITQNGILKGRCLLECGKTDEAYEVLQNIDENLQNAAKFYSFKAQYYFTVKDYNNAIEAVQEFDKREKNSPLTYQMMAMIYESQNDDYNAHLNWAKYQLLRGNKDIAINEYLNASHIREDDANMLTSLATLLEESGDKNHAIEYYEKLVKLEPNNITAFKKLADFRNSIGDYRMECEYLEQWYETDKRNYELIKRLAKAYEKTKNKPSAVEFYKKYLQVATTADDYEAVKTHLAKLENTELEEESEGLIDKIMRFFNKG